MQSELNSFLPFEPEDSMQWTSADGQVYLRAWSVLAEAARGRFWNTDECRALVYDGWVQEDRCVSLDTDVATGLVDMVERQGLQWMNQHQSGEWSIVTVEEDGQVGAATDFLGSRHLYYGQRQGQAVISNRAMVAAAALHGGALPAMNPDYFAWLLSTLAAPFGDETPWPSVRRLRADESIRLSDGRWIVERRRDYAPDDERDWERWHREFVDRCGQIRRFPDISFRLGLTGGKDSRLVLAGMQQAGVLDKIDSAYLRAWPDHPDVVVGQRLANECGLDFELVEPGDEGDLFEGIDRHNFQTEFGVNAWDMKGVERRARSGSIHGNLGETYRGHTKWKFALGWPLVHRHYTKTEYVDPLGLLQDSARDHCRKALGDWIEEKREQGHPRLQVNDAHHRLGRMQGWVGQAQLCDGCGVLALNPIPSPGLLRLYQGLHTADRQGERVHFELMRRCDGPLWKKSFAHDRWSPLLFSPRAFLTAPTRGSSQRVSPQVMRWQDNSPQICQYLMAPSSAGFFELVDRSSLLQFVEEAGPDPGFVVLRAIWGLLGIRRALEEPFRAYPMTMEK